MAPDICLDWALLLLTGQTGRLASEVYVVSLLQCHHAPRGRTLIIRDDLKGIRDGKLKAPVRVTQDVHTMVPFDSRSFWL